MCIFVSAQIICVFLCMITGIFFFTVTSGFILIHDLNTICCVFDKVIYLSLEICKTVLFI